MSEPFQSRAPNTVRNIWATHVAENMFPVYIEMFPELCSQPTLSYISAAKLLNIHQATCCLI